MQISISGRDGAVGEVTRMVDWHSNETRDWREAVLVLAFFPDAEPHWRFVTITPDNCVYTQTTQH